MKKLLFLGAMAAMLLGTASCSNDMEPEMTGDGNVQFTIELPGNIDSRAISDGLIATKLQVAVYKEDGTLLQDISLLGDKAVTMSGKKATVNFKLVKGLKYSFAFWAQNPNEDAYTFDAASGKVTVDYSKAVANADDGDAFSNREMNLEITGPITKTITLTRPFAQLNYGDVVADYNAAVAAGIDFKQTAVTVKQVANEYDILNQTTTGEVADITWAAANSAMEENLVVNEEAYKWLSMCYFLVPNDESTVTTELSMLNAAGTEFNKITVDNVPVKKNHRTNILGSLFTEDVNFNVIIDQNFDVADYNIDYNAPVVTAGKANVNGTEYNTIADAIAVANGNTIYLGEGTYNEAINAAAGETVSIHAGKGLNADDVIINKPVTAAAGSTLDMKNVTVKGTSSGAGIEVTNATATLDGVKSSGNRGINVWADGENGSKVTIKNSEMIATGTYSRGINVGDGSNNEVTVEGSKIQADYYAFNLIGSCDAATITVKDSEVTTGWAISNIWGNNNTVEYDNCTLNSINDKSYHASNAFSAFVYNTDASYHATNNIVKVTRCKVNVESTKGNMQSLIGYEGTNNQTIMSSTDVIGKNTNTNGEPITFRATGGVGCNDLFDNDWNFIGTNQIMQDRFNFEDVTINWDGENINWAQYITVE